MISRILFLIFLLSASFLCHGQTVNATSLRAQVPLALEAMVRNRAATLGFAANDPRILATEVAAASRWGTLGRAALTAARFSGWAGLVISVGIPILDYILKNNGDGTVSYAGPPQAPSEFPYWSHFSTISGVGNLWSSDPGRLAQVVAFYNACGTFDCAGNSAGQTTRCSGYRYESGFRIYECSLQANGQTYNISGVALTGQNTQVSGTNIAPGGLGSTPSGNGQATEITKPWEEFIDQNLPASSLSTSISPDLLANLANNLLTGSFLSEIPGTLNIGPFTSADAQQALATNPVTLAGALQSPFVPNDPAAQVTETNRSTWNSPVNKPDPVTPSQPAVIPVNNPVTAGVINPQVGISNQLNPSTSNGASISNLGIDPGVGAPVDTEVPSIWIAISSQFDPFRVQMSPFGATCPVFSIPVLGNNYQTTGSCEILDQIHPIVLSIFSILWTLSAGFILLRRS